MMTNKMMKGQLKRVKKVSRQQWAAALSALLMEIAVLLHGRLSEDEAGRKVLVGGYTQFGAHSEVRLGGEALYHYQGMVVERLLDGSCEWQKEKSLEEQLKEMAEAVIDGEVKVYRKEKKEDGWLGERSGLDVEWLGEGVADEEDDGERARHEKWERVCEAAEGDQELEALVQATGECRTMKEVNERVGLRGGDRDRLMKRLKRRIKKIP